MANQRIDQLYRAIVMDHYKSPHNQGQLARPSHAIKMLNPSCGDIITLECTIEGDAIQDLAFHGVGCAISVAAASMMTDLLKGQSLDQAETLLEAYLDLILSPEPDLDQAQELLGESYALQGVRNFPARAKCATLAWRALEQIIYHQEEEGEFHV